MTPASMKGAVSGEVEGRSFRIQNQMCYQRAFEVAARQRLAKTSFRTSAPLAKALNRPTDRAAAMYGP